MPRSINVVPTTQPEPIYRMNTDSEDDVKIVKKKNVKSDSDEDMKYLIQRKGKVNNKP